jgi:hypothetical protein
VFFFLYNDFENIVTNIINPADGISKRTSVQSVSYAREEVIMKRIKVSPRRMTFVLLLITLAFILLACTLNALPSQGNVPTTAAVASTPTKKAHIPPTQPPIPNGWKLSTDPSGSCQVWTPSEWQLGSDFFLEAEATNPGSFPDRPGNYPPMGAAVWSANQLTQIPADKLFQVRISLVRGENVCSVWRIRASNDFTADEKSEMDLVGTTLEVVK